MTSVVESGAKFYPLGSEGKLYPLSYYKLKNEVLYDMIDKVVGIEDEKKRKNLHKQLCNQVRKGLDVTNVVGFSLGRNNEDGSKIVLIIEYPLTATEDNYYEQHYDQSINSPYILV